MKSAGPAPEPDPKIGEAALLQAQTGVEWMSFAKEAFKVSEQRQAELDDLTKKVTEQQLSTAGDQAAWAKADRERYETTFRPVEDQFVKEASEYGSPEKQEAAAAAAKADVQMAAANSRAAAERQAAGLGINPASGRFAGIQRAGELGTALATAGAANTARTQQRDKGLALKADVVNLGRGLPAQSAQAAAVGLNAGSSAVGLTQGANQQYLASTAIPAQGFQGGMAGYAGQAGALNQQYSTQVSAWDAQNRANAASAAGFGQALGGLFGLMLSDENAKENRKTLPEGAGIKAVRQMPVDTYDYKKGVADEGSHVGTMAQDFQEATGAGDGRTIAVQDAIGVTMAAVKDLDRKVDRIADAVGLRKPANSNAAGLRRAA